MAKGEQHPFGHDLLSQGRLATEAMHHPQLTGTALLVQTQQAVETAHTVNQHGLLHRLRHLYLRQKSFCLHRHVTATERIQSTLPYRPDVGQLDIPAQLVHPV